MTLNASALPSNLLHINNPRLTAPQPTGIAFKQAGMAGDALAPVPLRILGQLQVIGPAGPLALGPRKQQLVLAALLCNANTFISVESLMHQLWDDSPPRTARKNIQVHVSAIRALIRSAGSAAWVDHRLGGYVLHAGPDELDSLRFSELAGAGQRLWQERKCDEAVVVLRQALGLWTGPVLEGIGALTLADAAIQRLDDKYLSVFESWAEAEVMSGTAAQIIDQVTTVAQQNPFRERLRMVQMTALYQIGRRTEALAVYSAMRMSLASEFGLDPSIAMTDLYQSLLRHEPALPAPRLVGGLASGQTLPRDLRYFVGRDGYGRVLGDHLTIAGQRFAVLAGPVGIGKTALAVHTARRIAERFPDGCFFVKMRAPGGEPRGPDEILGQLLKSVAVPNPGWAYLPDLGTWQDWLAEHLCLVVLDDARDEAQVRPLLPELGGSAALITARPMLTGLGTECLMALPPFTVAEAVRLLAQIIGADRVAADLDSAERLVTATGLLPLAVQMLGDRLAVLRHVPLREFRRRLSGPEMLLSVLAAEDLMVRDRLSRAVADLPMWARTACERLSALPNRFFTLGEAASVLGASSDAAVSILEYLIEASVILAPGTETVADIVVYEMLPLIYLYVRETAASAAC